MTPADRARRADGPTTRLLLGVGAVLVAGLILAENPMVLVLLATDGVIAAAVLASATLGGVALLPLFKLGSLTGRWRWLLGAGLGIGLLANVVLLAGWAGLLDRTMWLTTLAFAGLAGAIALWRQRPRDDDRASPATSDRLGRIGWLWLLVCPFLALTILVASVPPGYLWAEEGNGYDVLEYHLQMPKEYLAAGRISYASHNVYANFPANVEMLYLVCMVIEGDAIDAAGVCKMLNAWLAALVVAAAWLIGRQRSPVTGLVAGVAAAGAGWLTYLSGVAYVENGMLFFGMLALATLFQIRTDPQRAGRWVVLSGLFVGLACGCKYAAIGLIGLPLFVALPIAIAGPVRRRVGSLAVFLVAALAAFAPWGIKNLAMTSDPFFPLTGSVAADHPPGWGQAQSEHFAAAHTPNPNERTPSGRLAALWRRVLLDGDGGPIRQRLGWSIFALACWASLTRRRDRWVQACWVMLFVQLAVWLWGTHLYARFAVPLLIPLIGLIGNLVPETARARRAVVVLLLLGTASSLGFTARLYAEHLRPGGDRIDLEGATGFFTAGLGLGHEHLAVINHDLPDDARILMLGDAKAFYFRRQVDYCVVFNRNPLVTLLRDRADAADVVDWLIDRGYTHVLVHWSEIGRLGKSRYGFPPEIDRNLFERLSAAGLSRTHQFQVTPTATPYAELYRVPAGRFR